MISFYKYQGTGNDFVMVDNRQGLFPCNDIALINSLCDRRFGIGADGLILLQLTEKGGFYMKYFNSDGRESSMCGNGGRCFARFIFDLNLAKEKVEFSAIDGLHQAEISMNLEGTASDWISLQMISVVGYKQLNDYAFEVNTGSPHFVQFRSEPIAEMDLVQTAKTVRYSPEYEKQGINVNYVNLKALKVIDMRTYERGVEDETLSCGTGATAAAISTALFNGLPAGSHQVKVAVKGGELAVKFFYNQAESAFEQVWLMGPAKRVFMGEISL
ncbi:MAG: diaminopimelate epimerase [bacterium]|nr:diaminopimelate epimerase [bacterium]